MQLSSSFNLFGIERIPFQADGAFGQMLETRNETKGMRWVIKPKFETPMLNFNSPVRNTSVSSGPLPCLQALLQVLCPAVCGTSLVL